VLQNTKEAQYCQDHEQRHGAKYDAAGNRKIRDIWFCHTTSSAIAIPVRRIILTICAICRYCRQDRATDYHLLPSAMEHPVLDSFEFKF
jgi:hypothetical protein